MKAVQLLIFVGILVFSTAGSQDDDALLEALAADDLPYGTDADDFKRALAEQLASNVEADVNENDEVALERIRELLARSENDMDDEELTENNMDDEELNDLMSRGWFSKVKDFFTETIPNAFKKIFNAIEKGVKKAWDSTKKYFGDLTKRGIDGLKKGIKELDQKYKEAEAQWKKASGKAKGKARDIMNDIKIKINKAKKQLKDNCRKMDCKSKSECLQKYGCNCYWNWWKYKVCK